MGAKNRKLRNGLHIQRVTTRMPHLDGGTGSSVASKLFEGDIKISDVYEVDKELIIKTIKENGIDIKNYWTRVQGRVWKDRNYSTFEFDINSIF